MVIDNGIGAHALPRDVDAVCGKPDNLLCSVGPLLIAGAGLGLKAVSSFFGNKSKKKQEKANKKAAVNAANIQQKRGEDQRRGRLAVGQSLLNGVPQQTGGGVRTNVAMDPALFANLDRERTYDFGSAIPESTGGVEAFLSGLAGDAADFLPAAYSAGALGGAPEQQAQMGAMGTAPGAGTSGALTIDDLLRLLNHSPSPQHNVLDTGD